MERHRSRRPGFRLPVSLAVIVLWSLVSPGDPQQPNSQPLELLVRPERVYVEEVKGTDRADSRCVIHVIVVAGDRPVELDEIAISVDGLSGEGVAWSWAGRGLESFLAASQSKILGVQASPDPSLKPGEIAGFIGVPLNWDQRMNVSRGEVIVQGKSGDGKPYEVRAPIPFTPYSPEVRLTLPFEGTWFVSNGHEPTVDAPHYQSPPSQFAYDFLRLGSRGRSFRREGKRNRDYLAYGQPILAAADGKVAAVSDGAPENLPGVMPSLQKAQNVGEAHSGNFVILEHSPKEFTLYAHLRPGSVAVKPGQTVRRGQVLGRCGNSGMSSEPHLHFQLMDGPSPTNAIGLPAVFHDFRRQDYPVAKEALHPRELVCPDPDTP